MAAWIINVDRVSDLGLYNGYVLKVLGGRLLFELHLDIFVERCQLRRVTGSM